MKIEDGNKLIAEFMGDDLPIELKVFSVRKYQTSWDWLMPVVEKIETLGIDNIGEPYFVIMPNWCDIMDGSKNVILSTKRTESKILMVYNAVVQFIQLYNTQQPK